MSRILKQLEGFNSSLTIGEVMAKIKQEEEIAEKLEKEIEDRIKSTYENSYFKYKEDFLGTDTTVCIHLSTFVRKERTVDWEFFYCFNGEKINFSTVILSKNKFIPNRAGQGYSEYQLKAMTRITEAEYLAYVKEYDDIVNRINSIQ